MRRYVVVMTFQMFLCCVCVVFYGERCYLSERDVPLALMKHCCDPSPHCTFGGLLLVFRPFRCRPKVVICVCRTFYRADECFMISNIGPQPTMREIYEMFASLFIFASESCILCVIFVRVSHVVNHVQSKPFYHVAYHHQKI